MLYEQAPQVSRSNPNSFGEHLDRILVYRSLPYQS